MLTGSDGVGSGDVSIGGKLGVGTTGGLTTGIVGDGTVSVGSGVGDGRPASVAT